MSTRKNRALLRALPVAQLAERLGVSERTINRYRKAGKVPEKYVSALESFRETNAPATSRELKKALALSSDMLASVAGVTKRTARKWKKAGSIPPRSRVRFQKREKESRPRKLRTREEDYKGRITRGRVLTAPVNAIDSDSLRLQLASWADDIRKSPAKRASYHVVAKARTFIDPKTEVVGSTKVFFPGGKMHYGEVDVTIAGEVGQTPAEAYRSFERDLEANYSLTTYIESVTMYVRRPV